MIVFHTVILKGFQKGQKSRNVVSFLYNGKSGVSIIDSIPPCHNENALKRGNKKKYVEDKIGVSIIDSISHCYTEHALKKGKESINLASFLY